MEMPVKGLAYSPGCERDYDPPATCIRIDHKGGDDICTLPVSRLHVFCFSAMPHSQLQPFFDCVVVLMQVCDHEASIV